MPAADNEEPPSLHYPGTELELFSLAARWKAYVAARLGPHIGTRVLEVGAGIGGSTKVLCHPAVLTWLCIEPDPDLERELQGALRRGELPAPCTARQATVGTLLESLGPACFDTVVYIDVLEHIEDDATELARAASHLERGGRVVVLAPAHNWLFSELDRAVGHYRRYDATMIKSLTVPGLALEAWEYLDTVGLAASLANRLLLKQAMPTSAQIQAWDRAMVPISRVLDPLTGRRIGKSIAAVWRRL